MKSPLANSFSGIVGYKQYISGKAPGLAGVVARGQTLSIRLTRPDGSLLASLAEGVACAVPAGTPAKQGIDGIPSAGPYYIASYAPRQQLILRRNPNYHGDRPHHLNEIVYTIGIDPSRAVKEIESGNADYATDGLPATAATTFPAKYGPGSQAAKAGHQQYFISAASGIRYLHMNTSRPLFADSRLRRAVNYAIDRRALFAQEQKFPVSFFSGGPPTSDYLAPSIAGAREFHLYPLTPDLRRAKRLAGHRHATAMLYAPSLPPWPQEAQIIRNDLKPLGIDVQIKEFPVNWFFDRLPLLRHKPYDLAVSGWSVGLDPVEWLDIFGGLRLGQRYFGGSYSHFDNPSFDRGLQAAEKLSGTSRLRAFGRLELDLERLAPVAAIATTASQDFFSARIGCQLYQPFYGIDLGALCLRR
jgi:ABC-type transport system substrate-binding protein